MTLHSMNTNKKRSFPLWAAAIFAVLAIAVVSCALYLNDYYRADEAAIAAFAPTQNSTRQQLEDGAIVYAPEAPSAGFIFYPGGKVEHSAYEPLMAACASEGILCVLVEMPFNLAVLDIHAAEGIQEQYPEVDAWYIGGHSLGGSMAASHLSENLDDYKGLVLLGSYSTADLSASSLPVLSVYGSEDRVLNKDKYTQYKANLPADLTELVIAGGCHAYFGIYGPQDGDGQPSISNEAQIQLTADAISKLIA